MLKKVGYWFGGSVALFLGVLIYTFRSEMKTMLFSSPGSWIITFYVVASVIAFMAICLTHKKRGIPLDRKLLVSSILLWLELSLVLFLCVLIFLFRGEIVMMVTSSPVNYIIIAYLIGSSMALISSFMSYRKLLKRRKRHHAKMANSSNTEFQKQE